MAFALIKESYSPAVPRFYRSVYLRPPARTDTGITCPRWSAGNQADATPVAASGAVDPASAGVAGRPGFAPGNRRADNVRHFCCCASALSPDCCPAEYCPGCNRAVAN